MTIRVSRCYETITPESAEVGDFADHGHVYEGRELTFRELVRELREFQELSCYPASEAYVRDQGNVWACQVDADVDYRTGEERRETLHCDEDSDPRVRRWWAKACRIAGLTHE